MLFGLLSDLIIFGEVYGCFVVFVFWYGCDYWF